MQVPHHYHRSARWFVGLTGVSVAIAAVGMFWLPWHVGLGGPVPGESYAFGFSNRTAILALAVAIGVALLARIVAGRRSGALEWFSDEPWQLPSWREPGPDYVVLVVVTLAWANVLWAWGRYLVDPAWAEARGFLNGMDLLALGKVPYRDFFYNYGPATLYVPYWVSAATGAVVGFETAYLAAMVLFTAAGFLSLFLLVKALALTPRERAITLGLCLAPWATISMGLQYTPFRYYVVPACIVGLDVVLKRRASSAGPGGFDVRDALAAAAAALCCLGISPEMGIAGSVGILAYAVPLWIGGKRGQALAVCAGCAGMNLAMYVAFPDYILSVAAFAAGGANFPIYPNVHNLVLIGMSLFVFPAVITAAILKPSDARASLAMGLAIGGGMMLPAGLGRCDPGHVFVNATVPAVVLFAAARQRGVRWWKGWGVAYGILCVLLMQVSYWSHYRGNYVLASRMRTFYDGNPAVVYGWKEKWDRLRNERPQGGSMHWRSVLPYPEELDALTREGPVMLVAGNEWNYYLARYLHLQATILPDYFHAYSQGAATPAQIDRKVRECMAAKFLLVPAGIIGQVGGRIDLAAYERGVQEFLSGLMLYPVRSRVRNAPYLPDAEIVRRLLESFELIGEYQGYAVLKRKAEASAAGTPASSPSSP